MAVTIFCTNPECQISWGVADDELNGAPRCPSCGQVVECPPSNETGGSTVNRPFKNSSGKKVVPLPDKIGRYVIRGHLGRGGFGAVYRAYDPNLDREVALKVPHPNTLDEQGISRFCREARAAAKLRHEHIVKVYDAEPLGEFCYIACEFIDGRPLSKSGTLDPRTAVRYVLQLLEALHHAHTNGIVHRDVKPGNVIIDKENKLFLTDFGMAGLLSKEALRITEEGKALGTPYYMAPEQIRGDSASVGPHSDQYAAGVILYELLTGKLPHAGENFYELGVNKNSQPAPSPKSIRPQLDQQLAEICLKSLKVQPSERFEDCRAFAAALRRWLDDPTPMMQTGVSGSFASLESFIPAPPPSSAPIAKTDGFSRTGSGKRYVGLFAGALIVAVGASAAIAILNNSRSPTQITPPVPPNAAPTIAEAASGIADVVEKNLAGKPRQLSVSPFRGPTGMNRAVEIALLAELSRRGVTLTDNTIALEGRLFPDKDMSGQIVGYRVAGRLLSTKDGNELAPFSISVKDAQRAQLLMAASGSFGAPPMKSATVPGPGNAVVSEGEAKPHTTSPYRVAVLVQGGDGRFSRRPVTKDDDDFRVDLKPGEVFGVEIFNESEAEAGVQVELDGVTRFAFADSPAARECVDIVGPNRSRRIVGWFRASGREDAFQVGSEFKNAVVPGLQIESAEPRTITIAFRAVWSRDDPSPPHEGDAKSSLPPVTSVDSEKREQGRLRALVKIRYSAAN